MPSLNKRKAEQAQLDDGSESEDEFDLGETLKLILSSKSNANLICDVLRYMQADDLDEEELALAVMGLEKWFRREIEEGLFAPTKQASRATFQRWTKGQLNAFIKLLMKLTETESDLAFPVLIRFYQAELAFKTKSIDKRQIHAKLAAHLLSVDEQRQDELEKFGEFFVYTDFATDFALGAEVYLGKVERNEVLASNVLNLLSLLTQTLPTDEVDVLNCMDPDSKLTIDRVKAAFQKMLIGFLAKRLTDSTTKKVLAMFDAFYEHISSPPMLADYITRCYNSSNLGIALLALHSLFKLITEYNFEYPDFYPKLYQLLSDDVVYSPSRVRFLHLLDMFLASPLLPLQMQAAFTKRLARLALHAPTPVILALLPLIFNMIRRNQALRFLINAPKPVDVKRDPYEHECDDCDKSGAMESSLWEIETLRKHFHPDVSKVANQMTKSLGIKDQQLPLDVKYDQLMEVNKKKKNDEECKLTAIKPNQFVAFDAIFSNV